MANPHVFSGLFHMFVGKIPIFDAEFPSQTQSQACAKAPVVEPSCRCRETFMGRQPCGMDVENL